MARTRRLMRELGISGAVRGKTRRTTVSGTAGFYELTSSLAAWIACLSRQRSVAYLHFEFHGGTGFHAAVGWADG